jgi:hypothetical protein
MENSVHFMLQGKGGVGKSLANILLAQYVVRSGHEMRGFDTDQINTTFAKYKSLGAKQVNLLDESGAIDPRLLDGLMEQLLKPGGACIVDNGSNSFLSMMDYLIQNSAFEMIQAAEKKVFIDTVVAGSDNFEDTMNGFEALVSQAEVPVVVWLNHHFGDIPDFTNRKEYENYKQNVRGLIVLQKLNPQTFGVDIKKMTTARHTVHEVMGSEKYNVMEKQRIKIFADAVFSQLANFDFS